MDLITACYVCLLKRILKYFKLPEVVFKTETMSLAVFLTFIEIQVEDGNKNRTKHVFHGEPSASRYKSRQRASYQAIKGLEGIYKFQIADFNFSARVHAEHELQEVTKENTTLQGQLKSMEIECNFQKQRNAFLIRKIIDLEAKSKRSSGMEEIDEVDEREVIDTMILSASRPNNKRTVFDQDLPEGSTGGERGTKYMFDYFNAYKLGLNFKGGDEVDPKEEVDGSQEVDIIGATVYGTGPK